MICAGAWAYKLIPELTGKAVPERQVLIWLRTKTPEQFTPERFPVWNGLVEEGRYYGFPEFNPDGKTPGMKFGRWHHRDEISDPDTARSRDPSGRRAAAACLRRTLFSRWRRRNTEYVDMHVHQSRLMNTGFWIRCRRAPQVSFAAGFSGHGFKMASVIGEIMADLAQRGATDHDISLHQLSRLNPA